MDKYFLPTQDRVNKSGAVDVYQMSSETTVDTISYHHVTIPVKWFFLLAVQALVA